MAIPITFGADPEVFLCDGQDRMIPAGNLVPDGKQFDPDSGPRLVRDGVMLELRPSPADSVDEVMLSIRKVLREATRLAAEHGLRVRACARMPMTEDTLSHCTKDALVFGCDPDWSAYTGMKQSIKVDAAKHPWRYSGGHIHIGTSALKSADDFISLCKVFDLFVGLPTVMMDRSPDSTARRKLYGRAGSFRPQPHGFEWRVPSNFWLNSPILARAAFELSEFAYRVWECGEGHRVLGVLGASQELQSDESFDAVIQRVINTSDAKSAQKILADAAALLQEHQFPPIWWDIAVYLMSAVAPPFCTLQAEWSLGLADDEFDFGRARLRNWMRSLPGVSISHLVEPEYFVPELAAVRGKETHD